MAAVAKRLAHLTRHRANDGSELSSNPLRHRFDAIAVHLLQAPKHPVRGFEHALERVAATVLAPHCSAEETRATCRRVHDAIDAEIPAIFAELPPLAEEPPMPPHAEFADVLVALDAYRKTSPEMIVFSRMIRDALPSRA